jgi:serine/threonine protein kinase
MLRLNYIPNSIHKDLSQLSSEHKFEKLLKYSVNSKPFNTWYFRGQFADNKKFICKLYNKELLAPSHRKYYLPTELSFADLFMKGILNNENLVPIVKVIDCDRNLLLFMNNYPKTVLRVIIEKGPQNEDFAKRLTQQILKAVDYLHWRGIAHRDIKLDNIYVSAEDNDCAFKLSDFTCALKCVKDEHILLNNDWVGTEEYMAPEILERIGHDPRVSDIWSLGVSLFLVLYDCFPFRSGAQIRTDCGRDRMLCRQLSRDYLIPQSIDLSVNCIQMYRSLMTPEFEARPNAIQTLKHSWICQ